MLSKPTRYNALNTASDKGGQNSGQNSDRNTLDKPLPVLQSLIRADSVAIMQARVRYTRILRETRSLCLAAEPSTDQQRELQRYALLERRVKRQLVCLQQRLQRDIEQRNVLQAELLSTEEPQS